MKRHYALLIAAVLLPALLSACALTNRRAADAPPATPDITVVSASAFDRLGLSIDAPEGAKNVRYGIVSGEIAQVAFMLDGRAYAYRASSTASDVSGVYATFDDEEQGVEIDGVGWNASIRIRTVQGGKSGALATWRYGEARYSLYTGDAVDTNTLCDLAAVLAEKTCPRTETGAVTGKTLSPLFCVKQADGA